jgi:hypothetical protein
VPIQSTWLAPVPAVDLHTGARPVPAGVAALAGRRIY